MSNYTDIGSTRQGRGFREVCRRNGQPSDDHGRVEHRGRGGADSPARFIEVFVDSLDLEEMGFRHAVPAGTGRPAYHPGDLLKLYLYGYMNKIRSSRNLVRECGRNVEL